MCQKIDKYERRIALLAAIIALLTAFFGVYEAYDNAKRISTLEEQCSAIDLNITAPPSGEHFKGHLFDVTGQATIHERCKYIYIIVRGETTEPRHWKVTDIAQSDGTGQWTGLAKASEIPIGDRVWVHARISDRSNVYRPNQELSYPPVHGVSSNTVWVRRVK